MSRHKNNQRSKRRQHQAEVAGGRAKGAGVHERGLEGVCRPTCHITRHSYPVTDRKSHGRFWVLIKAKAFR